MKTVPAAQRGATTVEVRATAGLRMLPGRVLTQNNVSTMHDLLAAGWMIDHTDAWTRYVLARTSYEHVPSARFLLLFVHVHPSNVDRVVDVKDPGGGARGGRPAGRRARAARRVPLQVRGR
jgi:hypothetical protein